MFVGPNYMHFSETLSRQEKWESLAFLRTLALSRIPEAGTPLRQQHSFAAILCGTQTKGLWDAQTKGQFALLSVDNPGKELLAC
jgi:hypothetical protein